MKTLPSFRDKQRFTPQNIHGEQEGMWFTELHNTQNLYKVQRGAVDHPIHIHVFT